MAFLRDRASAPSALVTVITVGIATGIEAISSTRTRRRMSTRSDALQEVDTITSR